MLGASFTFAYALCKQRHQHLTLPCKWCSPVAALHCNDKSIMRHQNRVKPETKNNNVFHAQAVNMFLCFPIRSIKKPSYDDVDTNANKGRWPLFKQILVVLWTCQFIVFPQRLLVLCSTCFIESSVRPCAFLFQKTNVYCNLWTSSFTSKANKCQTLSIVFIIYVIAYVFLKAFEAISNMC